MEKAIDLVESGFLHLASGEAQNHPRRRVQCGSSATLHYMAAADAAFGYLGGKIYSTHPQTGAHFTVLLYAPTAARLHPWRRMRWDKSAPGRPAL